VAELDSHPVRLERRDQAAQLVEVVVARAERGGQLDQVGAQFVRLRERRRLLDKALGERRLQLGGEPYPPAARRVGLIAQLGR
jgi:hypothetical protein